MLSRRSKYLSSIVQIVRHSSVDVVKQKKADIIAKEEKLPIERTSLSRGLALNKFEKVSFIVSIQNLLILLGFLNIS